MITHIDFNVFEGLERNLGKDNKKNTMYVLVVLLKDVGCNMKKSLSFPYSKAAHSS